MEFVNRRGDRYFVCQGKTKTGKPKYYCSKKPSGATVERLPEGFEVHEAPESGLVSVRKIRPTRIAPVERERLARMANELAATDLVLVEVEGDSLVVYASDSDPATVLRVMEKLTGPLGSHRDAQRDWIVRHAHYAPAFRFILKDERERKYSVARWCYLGSIDGWYFLDGPAELEELARRYLPHVGAESFFELM
jgi:hypothetical protein